MKSVFENLIEKYWFAPADVLLRTIDSNVWAKQKVVHPILDIGCGDGETSKFIFSGITKIDIGIDKVKMNIDKASKNNIYGKMFCADATFMPFKDGSFKTVISNSTFEHIKDDIKAVSEVNRVLKNGGEFFFTVPSLRLEKTILGIIKKPKELRKYNKRVEHFHYRSLNEWRKILKHCNLEILESNYYFSDELMGIWYKLFKFATKKVYHRELWSYLKDSFVKKIIPQKPIVYLLKKCLQKFATEQYLEEGNWIFIKARKV